MTLVKQIIALAVLFCVGVFAMPAANVFFDVEQPDGSAFKVRQIGNESYSYKVTEDGFPIVRDALGYYSYVDGKGESSGIYVHDVANRTENEVAFLQTLNVAAVRTLLDSRREERTYQNFAVDSSYLSTDYSVDLPVIAAAEQANVPMPMPTIDRNLNSGERRALVILVQFQDVKFSIEDPAYFFDRYLNEDGFDDYNNGGSVRDYFAENSLGKFVPNFDVVGPITVSGRAYRDYGPSSKYGSAGARVALAEALDSLVVQGVIDFAQYDNDGDHYLDFVHMIYAGYGSNDGGADSAIWPHMWYMSGLNGMRHKVAYKTYVDKYACSQELDGLYHIRNPKGDAPVGVGTFIHEFSHLLGLGDHYSGDADLYSLGRWDVMDAGAYNCAANSNGPISCSPPYYSAFERMSLGWMSPADLAEGDSVVLLPLKTNRAYRVRNPQKRDEFFLLEYRDGRGWDSALPNHGMLIWHIDYDAIAWTTAKINTVDRMHVDIEEADGVGNANTMAADVFPGTSRAKVRQFNKFYTWDGTDLDVSLTNIYEGSNFEYVWFTVNGDVVYPEEDEPESSSSEEAISSSSEPTGCSGIDCDETDVIVVDSSSDGSLPGDGNVDVGLDTTGAVVVGPTDGGFVNVVLPDEDGSSAGDLPGDDLPVDNDTNGYGSAADRWNDILADGSKSEIQGILGAGVVRGMLDLDALPPGRYVVRIFSLNGNVLLSEEVDGHFDRSHLRRFGRKPLVLQILKGNEPIFSGKIQ